MQRAHHALDPFVQALVRRGTGEDVARRGHCRDEDLDACAVAQGHRRAGEVDEQLLPGTPMLAHRSLERASERLVVLAEMGVSRGAALRVRGHVLLPQQHQRHALAIELAVEAAPVGNHDGLRRRRPRL